MKATNLGDKSYLNIPYSNKREKKKKKRTK